MEKNFFWPYRPFNVNITCKPYIFSLFQCTLWNENDSQKWPWLNAWQWIIKLDTKSPSTHLDVLHNVMSLWGPCCLSLLESIQMLHYKMLILSVCLKVWLLWYHHIVLYLFIFFDKDKRLPSIRMEKNTSNPSLLVPVRPVYEFKPIKKY